MTTADIAIPTRDVEQVLREGGLSRFHKKAILVTGAAWTFVAMEILLVGFVAPIFAAKWNLSGTMQGLVNSAALAGSLCGSLALGRLADRIGRRSIFQYSILWYALFTAMEGVGKAAAIAGPYIFGNLKDATGSTTWSLTFVAIVMAAGGIIAAIFGRETRGHRLA